MIRLRNHRKAYVVLFLSAVVIFLLLRVPHVYRTETASSAFLPTTKPTEYLLTEIDVSGAYSQAAQNATLGFQKIFALSTGPSWRTRGLQKAAGLTAIDIEVFNGDRPDPQTINTFLDIGPEKAAKPDRGSTLAWLGHLAILRQIVSSGFSTAMILEDDADWDVDIKKQMGRLSAAVRQFTLSTHSFTSLPYGPTDNWDILWPGHCGELWDRRKSSLQYPDSSRIPQARYNTRTADAFVAFIRENHRLVQWASGPTCTFAYAVTLDGARKILHFANKGRSSAFDTELSDLCVFGQLRCLTVNPQLFVHYVPEAVEDGYVSEVERETKGGKRLGDDDGMFDFVMGSTQDIVNSARCMAIFGKSCLPQPQREGKDAPAMLFGERD